jgi:hypothetical protein
MIDFSPMARVGFIEGLEAGAKIAESAAGDFTTALSAVMADLPLTEADRRLVAMTVKGAADLIAGAIRAAKADQEKRFNLQMAPTDGRAN